MTRWGIVSTIKASEREILDFAAYHLELGAHRLYLYINFARIRKILDQGGGL